MNIIELSLTSPHGNYSCDTYTLIGYDLTREVYEFHGMNSVSGNSIELAFACQDNPIQSNSIMAIIDAYFVFNDVAYNIRLTGTPAIKIGANEYCVTYEDCRLPFDGSTAKIVCRWSE